jgi:hypothetical protein
MAAPSSVPSWWGFNQAVLDELRRRFLDKHRPPARAARAIDLLSLEDLDVAEFSQILADAFAGDTWFDALRALDGQRPNLNHHVVAQLAREGRLQVVLTTNFDTLIERAMAEAGVVHRVHDVLADSTPPIPSDSVEVVKLHGTATRHSGLVDLGSQKRRGLPGPWLDWLRAAYGGSELLVVGFSGADLGMRPDYLGLEAAAEEIDSLRWLASSRPNDQVTGLLRLGGHKFRLLEGALPEAWPRLGVSASAIDRAASRGDLPMPETQRTEPIANVGEVLDEWLAHPMVDADTCGLALTRLLDASGRRSAAQALRVSISTRVRRELRRGRRYSTVPRAALQIGQIAGDEPASRAGNALYCLDLASRALDAVIDNSPTEMRENPDIQAELAHNRATLASNRAYVLLRGRGRDAIDEATEANEEARSIAQTLTGLELARHESSYWELRGAIEHLQGNRSEAVAALQTALRLSDLTGNLRRHRAVTSQLKLVEQ